MSYRELTFTVRIPWPSAAELSGFVRRLPARVWRTLVVWQERANSRAILRTMDERMRRDMGIRDEDARYEAGKPFWRP
jgi:uncharacterized protein YjiS (DUF1127 family)